MRIFRAKEYAELSRKAANVICSQITLKPDSVLGLATGSSPIGTYEQILERYRRGDLDFSAVRTINLDEYKGLDKSNDQSYNYFMHQHLFNSVNIKPENINIPNGLEPDAERECCRYDQVIDDLGAADLQLLGIGLNGHIGFNEPGDVFQKGTHCVTLTQSTIDANKRFFAREEDVPRQAYTMGIGAIMRARTILLIASGESKAATIRDAFFGPITPQLPASVLQMHPDVILVADEAALSLIP